MGRSVTASRVKAGPVRNQPVQAGFSLINSLNYKNYSGIR